MDRDDFQLRARFRKAIRQARIEDGATLLVAVSGGSDSVMLLHLVLDEAPQRGWRVWVGHFDHRMRPDSHLDATWVRQLARSLSVPSIGLSARASAGGDFKAELPAGASPEEILRQRRRAALRKMALRTSSSRILLGHTLDDQAETVLLRLMRGSGVRGLSGMELKRGPFVRPLLQIRRRDLRAAAVRRAIAWREDPSNEDLRFLRNRIRLRLLPLLESEIQPGAAQVLGRTGDSMRSVRDWLSSEVRDAWRDLAPERVDTDSGPGIRLDRSRLRSYHEALVEGILRRAFKELSGTARGLATSHVASVLQALRGSGPSELHLPAGIRVYVNRQELRLVMHGNPGRAPGSRIEPSSRVDR